MGQEQPAAALARRRCTRDECEVSGGALAFDAQKGGVAPAEGAMSIRIACPVCEMQVSVREELVGKRIRCLNKTCATVFVVQASPHATAPQATKKPGSAGPDLRARMSAAWVPAAIGAGVIVVTLLIKVAFGISLPILCAVSPLFFVLAIAALINPEVLECARANIGVGEKTMDNFPTRVKATYMIVLGVGL